MLQIVTMCPPGWPGKILKLNWKGEVKERVVCDGKSRFRMAFPIKEVFNLQIKGTRKFYKRIKR